MHDTKDIQGTESIGERRAMLAGIGAIVLWGALATLSVTAVTFPRPSVTACRAMLCIVAGSNTNWLSCPSPKYRAAGVGQASQGLARRGGRVGVGPRE